MPHPTHARRQSWTSVRLAALFCLSVLGFVLGVPLLALAGVWLVSFGVVAVRRFRTAQDMFDHLVEDPDKARPEQSQAVKDAHGIADCEARRQA